MRNKLDFSMLRPGRLMPRLRDAIIGGWYFPGDELSRDRMNLINYAFVNNVIVNLVGGNYFTGLLLLMNADDNFIGLTSMIPLAANLVYLLGPPIIERFTRRKNFLIAFHFLSLVVNTLMISIIPFLPIAQQARLTLVALALIVVNCTNAIIGPGMSMWHLQFLPKEVRAGFFSSQSMGIAVLVAIVTMGASALVDAFKAHGSEITGIMAVRGIAIALMFLDAFLLLRMREYPYASSGERVRLADVFTKPLKDKIYMRTVIIAVLYGFSINIPSTFFTVYLLQNVKVGYTYITALSLLNIPCMVLFTPLWRKVISRTGSWFKMIQIAMTGYLFNYILLALVTPANYFYMYPLAMLVAYPFNAGLALGFTNELYINMPAENGTLYSAFHTVAYSVASFLGVTVSRAIMQHTEGVVLNILGIPMINKQFYLLVAAAVMGVSSVVIFFLRRNLAKEGYDS
jgi:MFS family permease